MRQTLWVTVLGLAGILGGVMPAPGQIEMGQTVSEPIPASEAVEPQTQEPEDAAVLEPRRAQYAESVAVTASAVARERNELPVSVVVIDSDEIEARQAPSVADLIASVSGVSVAMAGPPGQQTSVFVRGAESDQTLLLWNGVQLNSPYFGGFNWQFLGSEGVERIEVVRSPASTLYGGNAIGGVVQILSGQHDGGQLRLEGGEDGYYRAGIAAGHDLGPTHLDVAGGIRRGDSEFDNGHFDSEELVAKLGWAIRDGASLALVARVNDSESGIPFSFGVPSRSGSIAWEERELALPFSASLGDSWTLAGQVSRIESEYAFRDPGDAFGFTSSDTDSQAERARAVVAYRRDERLSVALGAEIERLEVTDVSVFGPNLEQSHQRTWAGFGEVNYQLGRVALTAGLRRDDNDVFGAETSLRAGANLRLTEESRLKLHYGEAFRPPTLGELFFPFSGNTGLEPERGESYELGWELDRGTWSLELTVFQLEQENLIDFDVVANRFANILRARSRGAEGAVGWGNEWVDLRANVTYLEAENLVTGTDLLRRPQESANLFVTVKPGRFALTAAGRFVGERPDFDPATGASVTNPSYVRLDLGARYRASARLAPYARVENVADRQYEEVTGYPAQGRTWVGGLTVAF